MIVKCSMNQDSLVITKQKYPFHTSLCKNILNLDENIRSTAIVDTDGTVYTLVHREGHIPAISDDESTTVLIQAVSRFSNRKLQEKRFGKTIFSMTLHEKLARVTIPIDNTHVLMFSVDRKAKSYDDVIKKTLQYLNKQRG